MSDGGGEICGQIFGLKKDVMRFSKKCGMGKMLKVTRPGLGQGLIILEKGSG
jgi:hypothetical protein